jgi:hypothetical protein
VPLLATAKALPVFKITPLLIVKIFFSSVSFGACMYYLNTGKKRRDLSRLIWGAVFGLLSALIFAL